MILLVHHRYRVPGGEERAVEDLAWLIREELGEDAELLGRDSAELSNGRAALGLLRGGLDPGEVAAAVRRTRARVVHAHSVNPGDPRRFPRPARLAALGLVPSENSSGSRRRQGAITKSGSMHARRLLVEAAWHYRRPPTRGTTLAARQDGQPPHVVAIS
jgi:transposase